MKISEYVIATVVNDNGSVNYQFKDLRSNSDILKELYTAVELSGVKNFVCTFEISKGINRDIQDIPLWTDSLLYKTWIK